MSEYIIDKLEIKQNEENFALEKYEEIVSSCSLQQVEFLRKNYSFVKLRDRKTEPHISTLLSITWMKIGMLCGLKENPNNEVWQDITNLIFNYNSDLTIEEIWKAFELERYKEYPEKSEHYQFFNSEYVASVLKKYRIWKQNTKMQYNISPISSQNQLPEISESQKKEKMDQALIRKFKEFVKTNKIEEPFVYIFDELLERDILKKPTINTPKLHEYYNKKLEEAKIEVKEELENNLNPEKTVRIEIKEKLKEIEQGNTDLAQIRAKRIVLKEFFLKHIKLKTDFEKFISNE